MATDIAIPIVFPDYLISVATPPATITVPDTLPGFDIFPDVIRIPATRHRIPELGHAGILLIDGHSGRTRYFEYGRYDRAALGLTRRVPVPDATIGPDGKPTPGSLKNVLRRISSAAGQGGRISGAYIEVKGGHLSSMVTYVQGRLRQNRDTHRATYELTSNSCVHFMRGVLDAGGIETPMMLDPRPNSYIDEIRSDYPALDFAPRDRSLRVGGTAW